MNTIQELAGLAKHEQLRSLIETKNAGGLMDTEYAHVTPEATLGDVLKTMEENDLHDIVVSTDGKKLAGVVSYQTLLKRKNLSVSTKVGSIAFVPQEITTDTVATELAEAFLRTGHRQIPVVHGKVVQGVVSRNDLLGMLTGIKELSNLTLADVMTKGVRTVTGNDYVNDAVQIMNAGQVRALPVVDDLGRVMGMAGLKDIARYNWHEKNRATFGELVGEITGVKVHISSVMVEPAVTAEPMTTLGEAAKIMLDRRISSLPVVDNGSLVGIVTKYDIIELLASFKQRDMVYTQITGLEQDDRFALDQMDKQIATSLQKISKISRPMLLSLHVARYNNQGIKVKYSLHGRLITENKVWTATSVDWDLIAATVALMTHFERRIIERKESGIYHRRRSRGIGHD